MDLTGKWYNELGSTMEIKAAKDGMLTGWYNTKVGNAKRDYILTGRYDHLEGRKSLGWTVTYTNEYCSKAKSTCSWSGQYQLDRASQPQILTTWLLTTETEPKDDWNSTRLGQNVFTRECPSEELILKTKQEGPLSHPREVEES